MTDLAALVTPSIATSLVRAGIWTYTVLAALGVLLALAALADGALNLRAVRRWGNGRQGAAWLWLGISGTALIAQAKLAVLGIIIVARPPRPMPPDQLVGNEVLVAMFIAGGLLVLAIQVATIAGRSALRHRTADIDPKETP